jgi:hypothetical protein
MNHPKIVLGCNTHGTGRMGCGCEEAALGGMLNSLLQPFPRLQHMPALQHCKQSRPKGVQVHIAKLEMSVCQWHHTRLPPCHPHKLHTTCTISFKQNTPSDVRRILEAEMIDHSSHKCLSHRT